MSELRLQLQSSLGDAYNIERELGGGGMSRVFLATERAFSRKVVIKVLPSETAGAVSIERFQREIGLAARLQQANIVPVLTAGDTGGVPYFTMPFVEGQSLRARLSSGGELPIPEAVGILKEVARALAYAHAQGVMHRDIKPDNVLVSGGTAMVTDFGVAKALSVATTTGGDALTATGLAVGTPGYIAPEQASGDPQTDHRADIYSFGCLAYELFSGSAPFAGRSPHQTIAAQMTETPDPVERRRPALSPQLAALVTRCLAKSAADRPQSAVELIASLDAVGVTPQANEVRGNKKLRPLVPVGLAALALAVLAGTWFLTSLLKAPGTANPLSFAVLPFANGTGDSSVAYLAEGLSDEVRVLLGSAGLSVKARGSSMQAAGKSAREAGIMLDVETVLQGTLTRTATVPRVVAELVRVSDETVLWNKTVDLPATARTTFRDSLVREIATALHARVRPISPGAPDAAVSRGTNDDAAFDAFIRGEYFRRQFDAPRALALLQEAIDRDSAFARAHASLALTYAVLPLAGSAIPAAAMRRATKSADKALLLSPNASLSALAKGLLLWTGMLNYVEAEAAIRRAVELDSTNVEARVWHAFVLAALGRLDEATAQAAAVLRADPYSPEGLIFTGAFPLAMNRFREVVDATPAILRVVPQSSIVYWNLAEAYAFLGKPDSAVTAVENMLRISGGDFGGYGIAMFVYASAGQWDKVRENETMARRLGGNSPNYLHTLSGLVYGDYGAAMTALERGVAAREPVFNTVMITCEPMFAKLHSNPRFVALANRLGSRICPEASPWPIGPSPKR